MREHSVELCKAVDGEFWFYTGFERPPMSMNDRLHHYRKAKLTAMVRGVGYDIGRVIGHLEKCRVELVWIVHDRRKRDSENPVATLKPLCDGLVDAGVCSDDTPELMQKAMPEIRFDKKMRKGLYLRVIDLGDLV